MTIVDIKGINKQLVLVFKPANFQDYLAFLENKFSSNSRLFDGSSVVFKGEGLKSLSQTEVSTLQRLCLDYGMTLSNVDNSEEKSKPIKKAGSSDLIIHKTLRSGQKVHSEGSVLIWGDVHESAEITAAQDVIVLGKLEGIAHAGCYGDAESYIFALNLCPRQLRIADKISRSSETVIINDYPEIAYADDNAICIQEYNPHDLF